MRYKALGLVGIIIALLVIGFFTIRSTPYYSLYQLKRAVDNNDPEEALKYINIDSIIDNLARSFFGKKAATGQEAKEKPSFSGMVADALPGLKDSIRSSLREAIASHGKKKEAGADQTKSHNEVIDNHSRGSAKDVPQKETFVRSHKKQSFSIGGIMVGNLDVEKLRKISLWDLVIKMDGTTAIVHAKDEPHIKAKMTKTDAGYWQFVEIILSP